jgi:phosphatidylglycerophosphatase A
MNFTVSHLIASGFYSGLAPKAPGTVGSLACVLLWWILQSLFPSFKLGSQTLLLVLVIGIGFLSTRRCLEELERNPALAADANDPKWVVIDEWAGMLIPLYAASPSEPATIAAAFALFRLFDILKPGPVKRLERLHGAWGVMLDDIAAGIFALLVIAAVRSIT